MKIGEFDGYEMHVPTSGGKAGKGHNRTSTIQIRFGGCIVKQIRFCLTDADSRKIAIEKAKQYVRLQKTTLTLNNEQRTPE